MYIYTYIHIYIYVYIIYIYIYIYVYKSSYFTIRTNLTTIHKIVNSVSHSYSPTYLSPVCIIISYRTSISPERILPLQICKSLIVATFIHLHYFIKQERIPMALNLQHKMTSHTSNCSHPQTGSHIAFNFSL